ncbi:MAG TPA: TonB-dependent receptor [Cyclobacteriaceae bacterium]|nr:TonB-dependent receptor [Cyclobacteriaceae bacterium]
MRLLILFIFLLPSIAIAQGDCHYTFSGSVLSDGNPLPGAAITIDGKPRAITDTEGRFKIEDLCARVYNIEVSYVGYKNSTLRLELKTDATHFFNLEEQITNLEEVVVTGKHEATEHVQNYATLTGKDLAKTAGKTLGESLKEVSGVNTIQAGPGIFKPVIHGVHSTRVLILNHGIRQEGQQWGAEHAPEVDPFIASEIIVIKDASAIKYGTDALGGVIVVNPAALPEQAGLGGSMNMIGQSNGRAGTVSGMLEGGIKDRKGWGWRLQGTAKRAGDYHTPDYQLTNTGSKELDFSAATGYHGETFGAEVFFSHFQTELGVLKGTAISNVDDLLTAMEKSPPQYTSDFSYNIGEPRQQVAHNLLKVNMHKSLGKNDLHFQYGLQSNARKEFDIRRGSLSELPAIDLKLNTHTLEAEWEIHNGDKGSFCFGANGMFQQNSNIPGTQRIPFIPNYSSFSGGPFAVAKWLLKSWTLDLGARYDYRRYNVSGYDFKNTLYRSSPDFQNVSATAGATVKLKNNQSLSFNVSSAWRPPHVAELYSLGTHQSAASIEYGLLLNDTTNEVMDISSVDFKIEKALKWVNTYRYETERLQLEATAYANFIFNYIYLKPTGVTTNIRGTYPYFRYTQTNALFTGLDLSAMWQVSKRFAITPKVSLLRASDYTHHDYLVFVPSNRFELGGHYEIPKWKKLASIFVESKWKYVMRQYRAPRVVTVRELQEGNPFAEDTSNFDFMAAPDGYWLWNISAGMSVPGKRGRYEFRVTGENVLNTRYREYTNRFRYYADDLGSNVIIAAKYVF